jgi:hypothetical protein
MDKVYHILVGVLVACGWILFCKRDRYIDFLIILLLLIATLKEAWDWLTYGFFNVWDLVATVVGGYLVIFIYLIYAIRSYHRRLPRG